MLPDKTWFVRFETLDESVELCEHVTLADAEEHYSLFDESDADVYRRIALIERDWSKDENECDTVLEEKVFA